MTLDDVIDKIRKAYAARVASIKSNTEKVRNAVNGYEVSAQEDALNQFLVTNGLAPTTTEKKADTAALSLLEAVENLPELRPPDAVAPVELIEGEEEEEEEREDLPPEDDGPYPLMKADGRPVLIFGGFAIEAKKKAIERKSLLSIDWISNERNGNGDSECANASKKIRGGAYSALIILNELMSHRQSDVLIRAAKCAEINYAIGKKGGTGALMAALTTFEEQRRKR